MSSYCKVWINNQEIEADPERKLMDVLRNDLRLKSVKDGCSEGACGTCTVLVDGKPVKACVQKMSRMEGKHILTVEGLSQREKDVYVYAFGEAGAVQCGFCIPGMVICASRDTMSMIAQYIVDMMTAPFPSCCFTSVCVAEIVSYS